MKSKHLIRKYSAIVALAVLFAACTREQHEQPEPPEVIIPVTGITHNLPATLKLVVGATLTFDVAV